MQRFHLVACAMLIAVAGVADAKEIWEGRWIEIRSEHFVLASALSEQRSTALALQLENFRAAVDALTGAKGIEDPIPTKIYLLPRAEEALGFRGSLGGYFSPQMRANYAVMIPSGSYSDDILKHEYTHYLIANQIFGSFHRGSTNASPRCSPRCAWRFRVGIRPRSRGRINNLVTENWISL
jgi:hypothetical protein